MGTVLFVLGIIGAIILALIQGGWNPFVSVGSSYNGGSISAIYNMVKGGKRNKSNKGKSNK
jgi:hypothetical protein